jgi:hypothetical protein
MLVGDPTTVILNGMTHRVGPKGQVVIPKDMRDRLGIAPGVDVVFTETPEGVLVRPASGLASLRGALAGVGLATELRAGKAEDAAREQRRA